MRTRPGKSGSLAALALLLAYSAAPQESALLGNAQAVELCTRVVQLMESATAAIPGLARAGAPAIENARQALGNLRAANPQDSPLLYSFLGNARAFLALADAMPKPFPFPEEGRRQLHELRETSERAESHFRALLAFKEAQLRNPDRDNMARYHEANLKLGPPQPGNPRVVFLGDSITDGWRLNEYFPSRDFVNRGISGQTTGQMLGRMQADVINLKPAAMIVLAGTNDIARGVEPEVIRNNLAMIAALAEVHKIRAVFAAVLPIHDYHKDRNPAWEMSRRRPMETIRALNSWIAALCKQRGFTYLDYFAAMVDSDGFLKAELADDGLHPNSAGYRVMAPLALEAADRAAPAQPERQRRRR